MIITFGISFGYLYLQLFQIRCLAIVVGVKSSSITIKIWPSYGGHLARSSQQSYHNLYM